MRLLPVLLLLPMVLISSASAQDAQPKWEDWLKGVRKEAEQKGIRSQILDATLTGLTPLERVIKADQNHPYNSEKASQQDHDQAVEHVNRLIAASLGKRT